MFTKLKSGPNLLFADALRLDLKADGSGRIAGYGAVFGNVDVFNERVLPGAFTKSLAEHKARGSLIKMLWQHRVDAPIGHWDRAAEDSKGLYVEGKINLATTAGRDAYEHVKAGDVDTLSIGYREKQTQQNSDGVRDLIELDVYEVSPVTFAANREAVISTVKAAKSQSELIDMLRAGGLSRQAAKLVAAGGWKALSKSNQVDGAAVSRLVAQIDDFNRKLKEI